MVMAIEHMADGRVVNPQVSRDFLLPVAVGAVTGLDALVAPFFALPDAEDLRQGRSVRVTLQLRDLLFGRFLGCDLFHFFYSGNDFPSGKKRGRSG